MTEHSPHCVELLLILEEFRLAPLVIVGFATPEDTENDGNGIRVNVPDTPALSDPNAVLGVAYLGDVLDAAFEFDTFGGVFVGVLGEEVAIEGLEEMLEEVTELGLDDAVEDVVGNVLDGVIEGVIDGVIEGVTVGLDVEDEVEGTSSGVVLLSPRIGATEYMARDKEQGTVVHSCAVTAANWRRTTRAMPKPLLKGRKRRQHAPAVWLWLAMRTAAPKMLEDENTWLDSWLPYLKNKTMAKRLGSATPRRLNYYVKYTMRSKVVPSKACWPE